MKRISDLIITLPFLLIVASCSPPTDSDLLGTWELTESTTGTSDPDASIAFLSDGTFSAQSIPWELFGRKGRLEGLAITGNGTWSLDGSAVQLDFLVIETREAASLAPFTAMMWTKHLVGDRQLYFFRGDPDLADLVIFKKAR